MGSGRKTILNKELESLIVQAVEEVYYVSTASDLVGISPNTSKKWIDKARAHVKQFHPEEEPCTEQCGEDVVAQRSFMINVKRAQAIYTQNNMKEISKHRPKNWMAGAWLLERTQPDKFGMRTRQDISVHGTVKHKHSLDMDHRKRILEAGQRSLMIDTQKDEDAIEAEIVPSEG